MKESPISQKGFTFINREPDDKEWSAHVHLLNEYGTRDSYLRSIIQYARGGKFYPADMHVDLIEQLMQREYQEGELNGRIAELERVDKVQTLAVITKNEAGRPEWLNRRIDELKSQLERKEQ